MIETNATLTIKRTSGSRSSTGGYSPGAASTVSSGRADVQDSGRVLERAGLSEGGAVAFYSGAIAAQPGDAAEIAWDMGGTTDATVTRVRRLDNTLVLRYA